LGHTEVSKRPCRAVWPVERSHLAPPPYWRLLRRKAPGRGLVSPRQPPLLPRPPLPPSCPTGPPRPRPRLLPRRAKRCQDCWTRQPGTTTVAAPAGVLPRRTIPHRRRERPAWILPCPCRGAGMELGLPEPPGPLPPRPPPVVPPRPPVTVTPGIVMPRERSPLYTTAMSTSPSVGIAASSTVLAAWSIQMAPQDVGGVASSAEN
jgi:hypothetical protein